MCTQGTIKYIFILLDNYLRRMRVECMHFNKNVAISLFKNIETYNQFLYYFVMLLCIEECDISSKGHPL